MEHYHSLIRRLFEMCIRDRPITGDEESFANIEQLRAKLITEEDFLHAVLGFCRLHFGTRPMGVADEMCIRDSNLSLLVLTHILPQEHHSSSLHL